MLGDCPKLLRFRNIGVHTREVWVVSALVHVELFSYFTSNRITGVIAVGGKRSARAAADRVAVSIDDFSQSAANWLP
jgi:hypothetical protein